MFVPIFLRYNGIFTVCWYKLFCSIPNYTGTTKIPPFQFYRYTGISPSSTMKYIKIYTHNYTVNSIVCS